MMSVPGEEPERVAAILREILALSGTKRPSPLKIEMASDSIKLFDSDSASGIQEASDDQQRKPER